MKQIAVITGASSGIGKEFAQTVNRFTGRIDEVWVIARRLDRLEELSLPYPCVPVALDLSDRKSFEVYSQKLADEDVQVNLLINCSGFGRFEETMDTDLSVNLNMVDLNCQALMAMCQMTIPYMRQGSAIINIASVAAYQPIPGINVYGASKAFVLHFTQGLNRELRKLGIHVMAVCPFWTKTEFFGRAVDPQNTIVKKYIAMYSPDQIVSLAWKDLKAGRMVSMYGMAARFQTFLATHLPHGFVMDFWMNQQGLK